MIYYTENSFDDELEDNVYPLIARNKIKYMFSKNTSLTTLDLKATTTTIIIIIMNVPFNVVIQIVTLATKKQRLLLKNSKLTLRSRILTFTEAVTNSIH